MGIKQRLLQLLLSWGARALGSKGHAWLASHLFQAAGDIRSYGYARTLWADGRHEEARQALLALLEVDPRNPDALNLLGAILLEAGQLEAAAEHFRQALAIRPAYAAARNNLGNVHLQRNELKTAIDCYRQALQHDANYVEALTNLGGALNLAGRSDEAERFCRQAIRLAPAYAGAHCNLGNVLQSLDRPGEAIAEYREALKWQPGLPEALINLSLVMEEPAYLVGVIDYYEKKLSAGEQSYLPHVRIAQALQALDRWDEGRERLLRALEIAPRAVETLALLGNNHAHAGDIAKAIGYYLRVLEQGPHAGAHSSLIFDLLYLPGIAPASLKTEYELWARLYGNGAARHEGGEARGLLHAPIRVGYVSKDYFRHSVAYFLEPILECHDRSAFQVYCYSTLLQPDRMTERFRQLADVWRDVSLLSSDALVQQIAADEIDILVDLSGHTSGNRLLAFARKPAPLQITYLGHPGTTGFSTMDWRIGDAVTDPPGMTEAHYTEQIFRLPGCFLTYRPADGAPPVALPPSLAKGYITFGSFNNAAKINEEVVKVWARILGHVPGSRLFLKSFSFSTQYGRERMAQAFERYGIGRERLDLVAWRADVGNHLELYGEVDIALDPFPYNGTTTTCEALWMGVPVVCLAGMRHSGRVGASLLASQGLGELLGKTIDEYVRIAIDLAGAPDRLAALRQRMRADMAASGLLDRRAFVRDLESAYRAMWAAHSRSQAPAVRKEMPEIVLPFGRNIQMLLPDSLEVITRYVLEERGDWFEDEIDFVRSLIEPGMQVVDVGANYGVYALSASAAVGADGSVWAFEPDPAVAMLLRRSGALNGFTCLNVIGMAVSDAAGEGILSVAENSELNCLLPEDASTSQAEGGSQLLKVPVTTLDDCRAEHGWSRVDFLKIDAEGQEAAVVRGARKLLLSDAPLVMAEYKHGAEVNETLFDEFAGSGFEPYVYIPGLKILAPLGRDGKTALDPYLLNLFFCTAPRAERLVSRNLLARVRPMLEQAAALTDGEILELHGRAMMEGSPAEQRLSALTEALAGMEKLIEQEPTLARRLTYARLLADSGYRGRACEEYGTILELLQKDMDRKEDAAFLPPPGYEGRASLSDVASSNVLLAAVADWLRSRIVFSSFFGPVETMRLLNIIELTGHKPEEAARLKRLIMRRWYGNSLLSGERLPALEAGGC